MEGLTAQNPGSQPAAELLLQEALDQQTIPEAPEHREHFRIDMREKAVWAMRKLAHVRRRQAENKAIGDKEMLRIQAWVDEVNKSLEAGAQWLENLLIDFHRQELERDPKAKTIRLPHGELSARKTPDDWRIDEALFLTWAQQNHEAWVRVVPEVNKKALKDEGKANDLGQIVDPESGEIVPGVVVLPGGIKHYVKPDVGGAA